jgi:hypothetical protein
MRSVPNKSANRTGTKTYQHPKQKPYMPAAQPIIYQDFPTGIIKTASPAPKILNKIGFG